MNQLTRLQLTCLLILCIGACSPTEDQSTARNGQEATPIDKSPPEILPEEPVPVVPKIRWSSDFESARQQAENDGRPVIAYFTFDGCVWCDRLAEACFDQETVVELSRKFVWVKVDRDETPEIPKKLNVSAYPSLLILGDELENIYRFQSYQEPPEFIDNLNQGLRRFAAYHAGKEWMEPPTRAERIIDRGDLQLLDAPAETVPGGIAAREETIWLAQRKLYRLDADTAEVQAEHALPSSVGDLCTDGKRLFAVTYGWTAGQPIYVIDPEGGEVLREIVTEANKKNRSHGAKGIACRDGKLYVLSGMVGKVFEVEPETGEITRETQLSGKWLSGLDFRGGNFITGSRTHVYEFDFETGEMTRQIKSNYPIRNVASQGTSILLMEQPIFGFGRNHERIQVWPQDTKVYRWIERE